MNNQYANLVHISFSIKPNESHNVTSLLSNFFAEKSGVGVTRAISSILLFSWFFSIANIYISYWISCSYLTGVTAAQLRWHLTNMKVVQKADRYFCRIKNVAYREINEWSFSNPHPRTWSFSSWLWPFVIQCYYNKCLTETLDKCNTMKKSDHKAVFSLQAPWLHIYSTFFWINANIYFFKKK